MVAMSRHSSSPGKMAAADRARATHSFRLIFMFSTQHARATHGSGVLCFGLCAPVNGWSDDRISGILDMVVMQGNKVPRDGDPGTRARSPMGQIICENVANSLASPPPPLWYHSGMMHQRGLAWFVAALLSSASAAQQFGFHVIEPGVGQTDTKTYDLTQDGRRTLLFRAGAQGYETMIRQHDGSLSVIPITPGQPESFSRISGDGSTVVGTRAIPGTWSIDGRSIVRRRGGVSEQVTTIPGRLHTVNGDGSVITGGAKYPFFLGEREVAFRWTESGGSRFLVSPDDSDIYNSVIRGSDADGRVLCGDIASVNFGDCAISWSEAAGIQRLPVPIGTLDSSAFDVSSDGRLVVGYANVGGQAINLVWVDGLMNIIGHAPGHGTAACVSNTGVVVCESAQAISIWTEATGMMLITDYLAHWGVVAPPDLSIYDMTAISDDGNTFSGWGRLSNGQVRGFVVTVPAPGMVTLGLLGLAVCRRRRHR